MIIIEHQIKNLICFKNGYNKSYLCKSLNDVHKLIFAIESKRANRVVFPGTSYPPNPKKVFKLFVDGSLKYKVIQQNSMFISIDGDIAFSFN